MSKLALKFPSEPGETIEIKEYLSKLGLETNTDTKDLKFAFMSPADMFNQILPYIFTIAGIILFIMIIAGGFSIFTSAGNPEKIKKGQGMLINALIGFLIIFAAYWIIQLVEFSLGLDLI